MKLVLLSTAVVLLMSAVELAKLRSRKRNTIREIYRAANITPVPESILRVYFNNDTLTIGMVLPAAEARDLPTIKFDAEEGMPYTFMATSPDFPSRDDPCLSDGILGLLANLYVCSNGDIMMSQDSEIATWIGPTPAPGTGPRRFILNIYRQKCLIDTSDEALQSLQGKRWLFSPSGFVSKYDLISPPAAGCYFISMYPKS